MKDRVAHKNVFFRILDLFKWIDVGLEVKGQVFFSQIFYRILGVAHPLKV